MKRSILADVGGSPGIDCRGFCRYCYFKGHISDEPLGCRYCPPYKKGCDYCTYSVRERSFGFLPVDMVLDNVYLNYNVYGGKIIRISAGGDLSCYPGLISLTNRLKDTGMPIQLNYTSGKGFDSENGEEADILINNNVSEISYTVFSTSLDLRREWMNDKTPKASIENLKRFCESSDVYAASVIIPGVNDGEDLYKTSSDLEEMGIKGLILMRFANNKEEGLILRNSPIIEDIEPHSIEYFKELVTEIDKKFSFRVTGTPLWDPQLKSPYSIRLEEEILKKLPKIEKEATILTGRVTAPILNEIFSKITDKVNIIPVNKDIACLITIDDVKEINLKDIKETIIFPGRAFVHDKEIEDVLCRDGIGRLVIRGPERLTADGEASISMTREEVIEEEVEGFHELIQMINLYGV